MNLRCTRVCVLALATLLAAAPAAAAPGDLDTTYGTNGVATVTFDLPTGGSGTASTVAVAVQPDGKTLALASLYGNNRYFAGVARFAANGLPDATFGSSGRLLLDLAGYALAANAMLIQEDGKIVIAGNFATTAGAATYGTFVARLGADGSPDAAFGGGVVLQASGLTSRLERIVALPGGMILGLGTRNLSPGSSIYELFSTRFLANGSVDTTYGSSGIATIPGTYIQAGVLDALRQADGNVLLAVTTGTLSNGYELFRITPTGAFDTTFNGTGKVLIPVSGPGFAFATARSIGLLADGRIVAAGAEGYVGQSGYVQRPGFVRLMPDGTPDPSFGVGGHTTFVPGTGPTDLRSLAVQPNGWAVAVGPANNFLDAGLVRILPDGSLDPNIKGTGKVVSDFGGTETATSVALQADGGIMVGISKEGGQLSVARYEGGGTTAVVAFTSENPVIVGQTVSFSAHVFGVSLTGTLTFRRGGVDIPGCANVAIASGTAACPSVVLPGGAQAITVAYSGDVDDPPFVSPALMQYVLSPSTDVDNDGIPDLVEFIEQTDPVTKDNDVFAQTQKSARLFAMQQYRDFFGREGDTAGIAFYTNLLMTGGMTRLDAIDAFLRSPEFAGFVAPVVRLYFAAFNRVPDYAGLTFQVAARRSGHPLVSIAQNFTVSPEFAATYGSLDNTQYVQLLYQNVLGRGAVQAEVDYYVNQLVAGTPRGTILVNFSESPEYQAGIGNDVFATMMYAGMLRRTPETNGFIYWTALLDAGAPSAFVIRGFYLSGEYHARFLP